MQRTQTALDLGTAKLDVEAHSLASLRELVGRAVAQAEADLTQLKASFECRQRAAGDELERVRAQLGAKERELADVTRALREARAQQQVQQAQQKQAQARQQHAQQQQGQKPGAAPPPAPAAGSGAEGSWWERARAQQEEDWVRAAAGARPTYSCPGARVSPPPHHPQRSPTPPPPLPPSRFPEPAARAPPLEDPATPEPALRAFLAQAGVPGAECAALDRAGLCALATAKAGAWECRRLLACAALRDPAAGARAALHHARTPPTIASEFRALSRKVHPDKNPGDAASTPAFQFLVRALAELKLLVC
ncbi:hypothetical protein FOA52_002010 [Chlamydomonas sp. UWO 241]|nr:hypothetical protein FOA52_002010 [Chlamydomonas sp. UWO 241]